MVMVPAAARADEAVVTVGDGFAEPPPHVRADEAPIATEPEVHRSPVRIALGPAGVTTGKSFGLGVGVAAEFGTGSVGGRLGATWLRGEGKSGTEIAPTGDSVGQYTGEITLDLHKGGPIHPVIGMGAGLAHVSRPDGKSGNAGVGTGRLALEYALGLEDADVRVGAGVTGALVGPVEDEIKSLHAYAITGVQLAIGF